MIASNNGESDPDESEQHLSPRRKKRKLCFQKSWTDKYLMAPGADSNTMICMICDQRLASL